MREGVAVTESSRGSPLTGSTYSDLHIVLHNPIFMRAIWLCCDVTFWT